MVVGAGLRLGVAICYGSARLPQEFFSSRSRRFLYEFRKGSEPRRALKGLKGLGQVTNSADSSFSFRVYGLGLRV